jgi:hypothetical protein
MRIMKYQRRLVLLAAVALLCAGQATAQTWQEHRVAAQLQLAGYDLKDSTSPVEHIRRAIEMANAGKASPAEIGDLMDRLAFAEDVFSHVPQTQYEELLLASLQYKEEHIGKSAPELVPTLNTLSELRYHQNRRREMFELIARAQTIQMRRYGPKSVQAAEELSFLGSTYMGVGDLEGAESVLRQAVGIFRNAPNPPG